VTGYRELRRYVRLHHLGLYRADLLCRAGLLGVLAWRLLGGRRTVLTDVLFSAFYLGVFVCFVLMLRSGADDRHRSRCAAAHPLFSRIARVAARAMREKSG
jgi:hypothetical protein